ncbi:MAG: lipopolysaccharide assembly protein LapB [Burkholderiales bacterium]
MDFDIQWLLLCLPMAFGLGWVASRLDIQQWKKDKGDAHKAYFRGLNFLLNEQQDKAIDAFIETVQHDPQTSELHFALGNLFRRRGEYERAVRVHQHLLNRADLSQSERNRAQEGLAQDFLSAGLFDRAEQAWQALEGTSFDTEARLALLTIQERSRDWPSAIETAQHLESSGIGSYAARIAHYWCELAQTAEVQQDAIQFAEYLSKARESSPLAARPLILAGFRAKFVGELHNAIQLWTQLALVQPVFFNLVAKAYAEAAVECEEYVQAMERLKTHYDHYPSIDILHALAIIDAQGHPARLLEHLKHHPSLIAAQAMLSTMHSSLPEPHHHLLDTAISQAAKPLQRYRCAACGFEAQNYFWQCPACVSWDSFPPIKVEEL